MNPMMNMPSGMPGNRGSKKKLVVVFVVAAAVAVSLWWWFSQAPVLEAPTTGQQAPNDTTAAINQDLQAVDFGDLDAELQGIDQELNQL